MRRKLLLAVLSLALVAPAVAQKNRNKTYDLVYASDSYGETRDVFVKASGNQYVISYSKPEGQLIKGYADERVFVDSALDSVYTQLGYEDGTWFAASALGSAATVFDSVATEQLFGYKCVKYKASINSNTVEVWITDELPVAVNPVTGWGRFSGTMVLCKRNGSMMMELGKCEKSASPLHFPTDFGQRLTRGQLSNLKKEKMIITTQVFDNERIYFGNIEPYQGALPADTTLHFASGTVILKRVHLDTLPSHYQLFAEVRQHSLGDAYDRTGSIFLIPHENALTFWTALAQGIDKLPFIEDRRGEKYQGVRLEDGYQPLVELMRFFTPFGIRQYNDRVQVDGLEWEDEAFYKQEITDLAPYLRGEVWIGAFIGNYDANGHQISLDIKAYPDDYVVDFQNDKKQWTLPLFNTCNVMEMAGQNYGKLFATDSLTVEFDLPAGIEGLQLRYLSTGHGGWGGGDEFNRRENVVLIDGRPAFTHTPWRSDCGTFRELNPCSGNFWNGLSSSDYSRSGWCPGTATQPVYFDLSWLTPGRHTITIAIPQGPDEGGSFNAWNVSGVLVGRIEN